jgi:hypothetical protein
MVAVAREASVGDVLERVERERVRLIDLVFSDISGGARR